MTKTPRLTLAEALAALRATTDKLNETVREMTALALKAEATKRGQSCAGLLP